jgi:CubicO group peptidase (beta-lactamase class C family)
VRQTIILLAVVAFSVPSAPIWSAEQTSPPDPLAGFAEQAEELMKEWKVPGLAVGVVRDGETLLARGFGYRDVERELPVTPRTLFAIGSCSKAFTAAAAGILVDEGRMDWDTPVADSLPDFRMADDYATLHATPRDFLLQRSGLVRNDLIPRGTRFSRDELMLRLRFLPLGDGFRERFHYANLNYVIAGHLVGRLAGGTWEEFVRERIFEPLGMRASNFSVAEMVRSEEFAVPYVKPFDDFAGEVFPIEPVDRDATAPAGGINSNLEEMLAWLRMHLNEGSVGERRIISAATLRQLYTPRMGLGFSPNGGNTLSAYGMGWYVAIYRGHYLVYHAGIVDGYCAMVSFMPLEKLGVVILTNLKYHSLHDVLNYLLYDRLLGLEPLDFDTAYFELWKSMDADLRGQREERLALRQPGAGPPRPLEEYTGFYEHPGLGRVTVTSEEGRLRAALNDRDEVALEHLRHDVWLSAHDLRIELDSLVFRFLSSREGDIDAVDLSQDGGPQELVFQRIPAEAADR